MKRRLVELAAAAAVILFLTGCPQKSSDATLASIDVAGQSLDAAFSAKTLTYNVFVPGDTTTAALSVTTGSGMSTVEYDVADPAAIPLVAGPNVVTIKVTAENADQKSYKVTIWRCNATATVLDSAGGSYLSTTGLVLKVYDGSTLYYSAGVTANPQNLYLVPGTTYKITASAPSRAQDSKDSVIGADQASLAFICQKLEQSTFPAESPTITSFDYSTDADPTLPATAWTAIENSDDIDFSAITAFRVQATGRAEMEPTSWSGLGIIMGVDQLPGTFNSIPAAIASSSYDPAAKLFSATALFENTTPGILPGTHSLSVVIYDRSSNRVERSVDVQATAAAAAGADLSADFFQSLTADYRIYGLSREYFSKGASTDAMRATATGPITCRTAISFKVQDAATAGNAVPILGYKVARSTDGGSTWKAVGGVTYPAAGTGVSGTHTFYDTDPLLNQDDSYTYKVTVFTDSVHDLSATTTTAAKFLPAFTSSLVAPVNKATIDAADTAPDLVYTVSDPSLWSSSVCDYYYFAPLIRKKTGDVAFYGEFRLNLASGSLAFKYGASFYSVTANLGGVLSDYLDFDAATGTVTVKAALLNDFTNYYSGTPVTYDSGVTYEWDIFGTWASGSLGSSSGMTASWFQKSGTNMVTKSYADIYQAGQETLNGWFSFTVE